MKGKRICIVFGTLGLGGAERQGILFARYLQEHAGAQVEVCGLIGGPGRAAELCDEYGIPWRIVPFEFSRILPLTLFRMFRFILLLRKFRPDILLPYTMLANVPCGIVWRMTGAKLCVWNQRDEGIITTSSGMEKFSVQNTPLFISNSVKGKDFLAHKYNADPSQIYLVRNGIELQTPTVDRSTLRSEYGFDEKTLLACMVGNLHVNKDHETLLRAWKKVIEQTDRDNKKAVLLLAGQFGSTYESLRQLVEALGIAKQVRFLGKVDDITSLLFATDVFVLSSLSEGCPNAVIEAMSAGLAVAGTDIPGIREVVGEDGIALLSPPSDNETLARNILQLFSNEGLRARAKKQNIQRVGNEFSLAKMCTKTADILALGYPNN